MYRYLPYLESKEHTHLLQTLGTLCNLAVQSPSYCTRCGDMWSRRATRGVVLLAVIWSVLDATTALPTVEHDTPPAAQKQVRIMPQTRNAQFSNGPRRLCPCARTSVCHWNHAV